MTTTNSADLLKKSQVGSGIAITSGARLLKVHTHLTQVKTGFVSSVQTRSSKSSWTMLYITYVFRNEQRRKIDQEVCIMI